MQYLLMIYGDEANTASSTKSDTDQMASAFGAYTQALKNAGVMRSGERLQRSSSATTVRVNKSKTEVLNGPYAETREQLGGFYIIDVPDLDAAISWAARCPGAAYGSIEVRPIWSM